MSLELTIHGILPAAAGFLLDLALGDPVWLYHPVRLIGKLIGGLEKIIRNCLPETPGGERLGGAVLAVLVAAVSTAVPGLILLGAYHLWLPLGIALESFFCYQLLAVKSLRTESDRVYIALAKDDLPGARQAVSMIVGRDTAQLSREGVAKAAVETVAENTSDGVVAPLFYMAFLGAAGGFFYKAVNTMDSMIGYKNDRYRYFGTAAARLDDVLNYLPARLSALFMLMASALTGKNAAHAFRVYRRDRRKHKSPNAAQTEAVMAGALGVELAGPAWYFGEFYDKPTIGERLREIEPMDIRRAHVLLYLTAAIAAAVFLGIKLAVLAICL